MIVYSIIVISRDLVCLYITFSVIIVIICYMQVSPDQVVSKLCCRLAYMHVAIVTAFNN